MGENKKTCYNIRPNDVETMKRETTKEPRSLTSEDFEGRFERWKRRWDKCITTDGDYFEGDKTDL